MRKLWILVALPLTLSPFASEAQVRVIVPGVRVTAAPPPPRFEAVPVAPSPRHQWIAGCWEWRGSAHVWIPGHWVLPPAYGYVWEPARWASANGAWVFYPGHWRPTDEPDRAQAYQPPPPPMEQVVVNTAPPPPIEEARPAPPFDGAVWLAGYWHWNGLRHVWVAGRYSPRPAGHEWERHRWDRDDSGRWVFKPGHWHPSEGEHRDEGRR